MATVTIRPNAAGDKANWPSVNPSGPHYSAVADTDDATYVRASTAVDVEDNYNLGDPGLTVETVQSIDVRFRARSETSPTGQVQVGLRSNSANILGSRVSAIPTVATDYVVKNIGKPGPPTTVQTVQEKAFEITSTAENSTKDWTTAFRYIEDIGDQRGYTAGIVGFTSGTGDMRDLIENYFLPANPSSPLAAFTSGLDYCDSVGMGAGASAAASSHLGTAFISAWQTAADTDPVFRDAQMAYRQDNYWAPAYAKAVLDGLGPLGIALYYDTYVNHGPGVASSGDGSFEDIRSQMTATVPSSGGNETTWLNQFISKRSAVLTAWGDNPSNGRISMFTALVATGNLTLTCPFSWSIYGDPYTMSTDPVPYGFTSSGGNWTVSDLANLQVAILGNNGNGTAVRVFDVYVDINYSLASQNFGQTGDGTAFSSSSADANLSNRSTETASTPASNGTAQELHWRAWLSLAATSKAQAAIYDASGVLLAKSNEIIISNTAEQDLVFPFTGANQIALVAGTKYTYGVSWQKPTNSAALNWSRPSTNPSTSIKNSFTYVSGAPQNPLGSSSTVGGPVDMYLVYSPSGTGGGGTGGGTGGTGTGNSATPHKIDTTTDYQGVFPSGAQRKLMRDVGGRRFVAIRKKEATSAIYQPWCAYSDDGIAWTDIKVTGNTPITTDHQRVGCLAVGAGGVIHYAWYGMDPSNTGLNQRQIKYSRSTDRGITWSGWASIGGDVSGYNGQALWQEHPSIAAHPTDANTLYAVWEGGDATHQNTQTIKFSKSTNGGSTWSAWATLFADAADAQSSSRPCVQVTSDGKVHVAFYSRVGTAGNTPQVFHMLSSNGGTSWSTPTNISGNNSLDSRQVGILADGVNVHATWRAATTASPSSPQIMYAKYNGTSWGTPEIVSAAPGLYQFAPQIGVENGVRIIVWSQTTNASNYPTEAPTTGNIMLSQNNGSGWSPAAAMTSNNTDLFPNINPTQSEIIYAESNGTDYDVNYLDFNTLAPTPVSTPKNPAILAWFFGGKGTPGSGTATGGGPGNTVTVQNPGNQNNTTGDTVTGFQITAVDSDVAQTLAYKAVGLPTGVTLNTSTGQMSGSPTVAGTYTVTVTVTDGTGAFGSVTFTWAVIAAGGGLLKPGQLLNFAPWYLGLPTPASNGYSQPIYEPSLDTYTDANFYTAPGNVGVVFHTPINGVTTSSGTKYPRTELREMLYGYNGDTSKQAAWSGGVGTHTLEYTAAGVHLPNVASHNKVVIGQIHDSANDVIELMVCNSNINTTSGNYWGCRLWGVEDAHQALPNYVLGTWVDIKITCIGKVITVYLNGVAEWTFDRSTDSLTGLYFKAGSYVQANITQGGTVADYGENWIKAGTLKITHVGYP